MYRDDINLFPPPKNYPTPEKNDLNIGMEFRIEKCVMVE